VQHAVSVVALHESIAHRCSWQAIHFDNGHTMARIHKVRLSLTVALQYRLTFRYVSHPVSRTEILLGSA
jgi:hypothetical protein